MPPDSLQMLYSLQPPLINTEFDSGEVSCGVAAVVAHKSAGCHQLILSATGKGVPVRSNTCGDGFCRPEDEFCIGRRELPSRVYSRSISIVQLLSPTTYEYSTHHFTVDYCIHHSPFVCI